MELKSEAFWPAVRGVLEGARPVLGTVPAPRYGHKVAEAEEVKRWPGVVVLKATKARQGQGRTQRLLPPYLHQI